MTGRTEQQGNGEVVQDAQTKASEPQTQVFTREERQEKLDDIWRKFQIAYGEYIYGTRRRVLKDRREQVPQGPDITDPVRNLTFYIIYRDDHSPESIRGKKIWIADTGIAMGIDVNPDPTYLYGRRIGMADAFEFGFRDLASSDPSHGAWKSTSSFSDLLPDRAHKFSDGQLADFLDTLSHTKPRPSAGKAYKGWPIRSRLRPLPR